MSASDAKKQFQDNVRLFGSNPSGDPERYNLHRGLVNLAAALETIEARLQRLEQQIPAVVAQAVRSGTRSQGGDPGLNVPRG